MNREFWLDTWEKNEIGFHRAEVNPRLLQHGHVLRAEAGGRVFVPLCGKSLDLVHLAERGFEVVGVELSELAVRDFFAEHALTPEVEPLAQLVRFRAGPYTLYCGDLFALSPALLGEVSAYYDRAALVALPPALRQRYAAHIKTLVARARGLLVSFEYPAAEMNGPPFSVEEPEVRALFGPEFTVTELACYDILDAEPRFLARGLSALSERIYSLARG